MDNRVKSMISKGFRNPVMLDFDQFETLVINSTQDRVFANVKLLFEETGQDFILFFADNQWTYMTVVPKQGLDIEMFRINRLRNAIKIRFRQ